MTVCVAAIFNWNYGTPAKPELGKAIITATDRMISSGDIQYEPQQKKLAFVPPHTLIMIAGDYSLHSQAIKEALAKSPPDATPRTVAMIYGAAIQAIKRRKAEDLFLAPLGLNTDSFLAQQREMSEGQIAHLTGQLQGYKGETVHALIAGIDAGNAELFLVDSRGTVGSLVDVGFGAIGSGAWHAESRMMQAGYVNWWTLSAALATVFAAKKAAEVAPGVGKVTDIQILTRNGPFPLWPKVDAELHSQYAAFEIERKTLSARAVEGLEKFIIDPKNAEVALEAIEDAGSVERSTDGNAAG